MSDTVHITTKGYERLREELRNLTAVERPRIIQAIAEARAHGDLRENAEYHAAKERQGFIEGRIQEINAKMANINVIDVAKLSGSKVVFGATITFVNLDTTEETQYQIVGEDEVDLAQNKISISSPVARALIGKQVGSELVIPIPKGKMEIEILKIEFI